MKTLNSRVKGFTLVEMITVIAIIGVLLGVFAPAMSNYYWKSRVKAANADAKMIYNAAQTEVQKYIAFDRANTSAPSSLDGYVMISYQPGTTPSVQAGNPLSSDLSSYASTSLTNATANIVSGVNKTVSSADTKCWAVYINNYIVKASIAADQTTTPYVGYYSAGRITLPAERPTKVYSAWLSGNDANSLLGVASKYDTP
ncbi:MAG: prepilin-type N-terminal cleavage/methylation domain-containing protein [Oscillospiraceae bacterium]|nr:prepilin-type N-terminal cleavage/methylation domain-containing protein [Oscillospiraceae bacterium]